MRNLYPVLLLALLACGKTPEPEVIPTVSASTVSDAAFPTTYPFSGSPQCWTDKIRINGTSHGNFGNSGYLCQGAGIAEFWVGFYADGTLSYQHRDGTTKQYTAFANPANCHLGFDNAAHSQRDVIWSDAVLDADGYLSAVTEQYTITGNYGNFVTIYCHYVSSYGGG